MGAFPVEYRLLHRPPRPECLSVWLYCFSLCRTSNTDRNRIQLPPLSQSLSSSSSEQQRRHHSHLLDSYFSSFYCNEEVRRSRPRFLRVRPTLLRLPTLPIHHAATVQGHLLQRGPCKSCLELHREGRPLVMFGWLFPNISCCCTSPFLYWFCNRCC